MADEEKKDEAQPGANVAKDITALASGLKTTLGQFLSPSVPTRYQGGKSPASGA